MKLYIIRHSQPDDGEKDDYEEDPDPSLSKDGIEIVKSLAEWMLDKDEVPNVLFSSPSVRTVETAEILKDKLGLPNIKLDVSIGPSMSIKKLIQQVAADKSMTRVAMVSHHEAITAGLRVLDRPDHPDPLAQGELRIMRVDRKDGTWKEHRRVLPSDLGGTDRY